MQILAFAYHVQKELIRVCNLASAYSFMWCQCLQKFSVYILDETIL